MSMEHAPQTSITTLAALKNTPPAPAEIVRAGFDTKDGFELMQRGATLLANSSIVPAQYRAKITKKDKYGGIKSEEENTAGLSNCVVALNMAQRMNADPLMIMQNLYIVEGRPAWSSQYIIASINACGRYSPLHFDVTDLGEKVVEYTETTWSNNQPVKSTRKVTIHDMQCVAWATEKETGQRLESPAVSIEMAVREGWYTKNGSKWQTMPQVMLRYRAASFFGKLYAPELLMGIQTAEEVADTTYDVEVVHGGAHQVTTEDITPKAVEAVSVSTENTAAPKAKAKATKKEHVDKLDDVPTPPWEIVPPSNGKEYTANKITCPNSGKTVDEFDECMACKDKDGCPEFN